MEDYEKHWNETRSPRGLSIALIVAVLTALCAVGINALL